jgi:nickel-dependent lactate racemase
MHALLAGAHRRLAIAAVAKGLQTSRLQAAFGHQHPDSGDVDRVGGVPVGIAG